MFIFIVSGENSNYYLIFSQSVSALPYHGLNFDVPAATPILSAVALVKANVSLISNDFALLFITPVSTTNVTLSFNLMKLLASNITSQLLTQSNNLISAINDKITSPTTVNSKVLGDLSGTSLMLKNVTDILSQAFDAGLLSTAIMNALSNSIQCVNRSTNVLINDYKNLSGIIVDFQTLPAGSQTVANFNTKVAASFYTNVTGAPLNTSVCLAEIKLNLKSVIANIKGIDDLYTLTNNSKAFAALLATISTNAHIATAQAAQNLINLGISIGNTSIIGQYKASSNSLLPYINDNAVPAAKDVINNLANITTQIISDLQDFVANTSALTRSFYGSLEGATQRLNSYTNATVANITSAVRDGVRNAISCSATATTQITVAIAEVQPRLGNCIVPAGTALLTTQTSINAPFSGYLFVAGEPLVNINFCVSTYASATTKAKLNVCLAAVSITKTLHYVTHLFIFLKSFQQVSKLAPFANNLSGIADSLVLLGSNMVAATGSMLQGCIDARLAEYQLSLKSIQDTFNTCIG